MKNIKLILLSCLMVMLTFSSCDETLDINTDPQAAPNANPNALFPYVFTTYSARTVTELGTRICDVSQYISNTFNSPNRGNVSQFLTGNAWRVYYTDVLSNLSLVIRDAEAAGASSNNINAVAKIFSAHIYIQSTSLWEDIPFTEALNFDQFPTPQFDSQRDVLLGVVALLDESIQLIDTRDTSSEFDFQVGDILYDGEISKWRILANSLKLRALMLLRSGGEDVTTQINATLAQPLMSDNADAAFIPYSGDPGQQNAMATIISQFFGAGGNEVQNIFGPGDPIDALLNGSGDPRWDLWVARNDLPAPGNDVFPNNADSVLSNNIIRTTLPDMIMTPAEMDLYKAELALDGFTAAGDAQTNYRNGVRNSIDWWNGDIPGFTGTAVAPADVTAYVNGLATPTANDIFNEQYLASFLMPVLSWNHVRRNRVPVLSPPPAATIPTILKRFTYPVDETGANPNTPSNKLTEDPMWFENL
ncbi:SusD/RagB family nutrient-binding outer membrane lipoprotein [Tenacibaculum agarivorans]|uniref:SusD/RagB family nutrient-binding outer membrane lipoprotein n=1 Tax=Tenacibaculum agarivorans TaxID=1908389 RepID=UPI00094BBED5|nr:SusD/RagB family nutrient-binding outer membrane lipoprotein [Tenacibaculum agarivorans]